MDRYWVWEYGLFEKNPKRVDSLTPETTLEVVKLADAQATVEALQRERDEWKASCNLVEGVLKRDDLQTALDAEREKVAKLDAMYRQQLGDRDKRIEDLAGSAKIWMERYTQLQALVRALSAAKTTDSFHRTLSALESATLDATTPAPMDAAETHDRMFNHADRHPEAL